MFLYIIYSYINLHYTFTFVSQNEGFFFRQKFYNSKSIHPNLLNFGENISLVKRNRVMMSFWGTCSVNQSVSVYVCIFWICQSFFLSTWRKQNTLKSHHKNVVICSYVLPLVWLRGTPAHLWRVEFVTVTSKNLLFLIILQKSVITLMSSVIC